MRWEKGIQDGSPWPRIVWVRKWKIPYRILFIELTLQKHSFLRPQPTAFTRVCPQLLGNWGQPEIPPTFFRVMGLTGAARAVPEQGCCTPFLSLCVCFRRQDTVPHCCLLSHLHSTVSDTEPLPPSFTEADDMHNTWQKKPNWVF